MNEHWSKMKAAVMFGISSLNHTHRRGTTPQKQGVKSGTAVEQLFGTLSDINDMMGYNGKSAGQIKIVLRVLYILTLEDKLHLLVVEAISFSDSY